MQMLTWQCGLQLDDASAFGTVYIADAGAIEVIKEFKPMSAIEVYGVLAASDQFRWMDHSRYELPL